MPIINSYSTSGVHIITGGLGGFGLELAGWLLMQGAASVVLTSRSGIRTAWQLFRVNALLAKFGDHSVEVSKLDVTDPDQARILLAQTYKAGKVQGVWHSAVVLRDGLFTKMTHDDWNVCVNSKVIALRNLHNASIAIADVDALQSFVVFSSVTSMGGNCGQTAYGWANNACERLMESRRQAGLTGLAIQWGAIESAGLASQLVGETIPMGRGLEIAKQNVDDSLNSLHLLMTCGSYCATVSSYRTFVMDKKIVDDTINGVGQHIISVDDIRAKLADILGGSAMDYDPCFPLQEYGLDSLSIVEVMNWINRHVCAKVTPTFITQTTTCDSIFQYMSSNLLE
jgi:fatty acid synthase